MRLNDENPLRVKTFVRDTAHQRSAVVDAYLSPIMILLNMGINPS